MKIEKTARPYWPAFKRCISFTGLIANQHVVAWRRQSKVKCLVDSGRIYFVSEKDALAFWLRWE